MTRATTTAASDGDLVFPAPDSVARGTILLSTSRAAIVAVHAALHIAVGRLASPGTYGAFGTAFFILSWVDTVMPSLVLPGLLKIVSEDGRRYRAALAFAFRWYLPAVAAATTIYFLSVPLLARIFGDPHLRPLLWLIGLQLPFTAGLRLGETLLIALRRHVAASSIRFAYAGASAIAAAWFLTLGWGTTGAMAAVAVGTFPAAATAALFLLSPRVAPREQLSYAPMGRRTAHWTAVSLPATACGRTLMTLDLWLVKALTLSGQAGLYAVAFTLSRLPMFAVISLGSAIFPKVSEATARGDRETARAAAVESMRVLLIVFLPVSCLTAACAPEILAFLFSSAYAGAAPALRLLAAATPFAAWLLLCSRLIGAADRPGLGLAMVLSVLGFAAGLNWYLISGWGMMGGALASFVVFSAGAIAATMIVHRLLAAAPPFATVLRCLAAGAAAGAVALAWPVSGWMVLVELAALVLLFGILLMAFGEIRRSDLRRLLNAVFGSELRA